MDKANVLDLQRINVDAPTCTNLMNTYLTPATKKVEIIHFLQIKFANQINPNLKSVLLGEDESGFFVTVKYRSNHEMNYKRYFNPTAGLHVDVFYHLMLNAKNDFEYKVDQFINLNTALLTVYITDLLIK